MPNTGRNTYSFEITRELEVPASFAFDFCTKWASHKNLGLPFASMQELPDGRMFQNQEVDVDIRYLLFFHQPYYILVESLDRSSLTVATYSVQPALGGIYAQTVFEPITDERTQSQSLYAGDPKQPAKASLEDIKNMLKIASKRMNRKMEIEYRNRDLTYNAPLR